MTHFPYSLPPVQCRRYAVKQFFLTQSTLTERGTAEIGSYNNISEPLEEVHDVSQDVFPRLVAIAFHTEGYKSTRDKQLTVRNILLMLLNIPDSVCLFDGLVCAYFKLTESPVW